MYKLLIVDDEAEVRNGYANYYPWAELGFVVCGTVANGVEALSFIRSHDVDVLLCDIAMPEMDGVHLAQVIAERHPQIEIVMLTAHNSMEQTRKLIKCRVFSYVLKYEKNEVLMNTMRELAEALNKRGEVYEDAVVKKIKRYVEEHLDTANLCAAAEVVGLSESYVSRIFKERNNQNFYTYVLQMKMLRAKQLLSETDHKVYMIAEQLGYTDAKNFNRTFKRIIGLSPKEYQIRCRNRRSERGESPAGARDKTDGEPSGR